MSDNHNFRIYSEAIKSLIPNITKDDLYYLCNQSASIYQKLKDNCVDNYRIGSAIKGFGITSTSECYQKKFRNGCCGFKDIEVTNPATGNTFMIGFNYGH